MSDEARAYVKKYSPFSNSTFWVHYALADIANAQHDYELWVTDHQLVDEWALSIGSIRRAYAELRAGGFLTLIQSAAPGRRAKYRFEFLDVPVARICNLSTGTKPKLKSNVSHFGTIVSQYEKRSPIYVTEIEQNSLTNGEVIHSLSLACQINLNGLTARGREELTKVAKELIEVGADSDQIERAVREYRNRWPNARITPSALSKHWATLLPSKAVTGPSRGLSDPCEPCSGTGWKHINVEEVGGATDVTRCDVCHGAGVA